MDITVIISIIAVTLSVLTFFFSRKDKAVKDIKENNPGLIEYQLKELKEDVKTILSKLDKYDKDIDDRIDKALDLHIKMYHNGGKE